MKYCCCICWEHPRGLGSPSKQHVCLLSHSLPQPKLFQAKPGHSSRGSQPVRKPSQHLSPPAGSLLSSILPTQADGKLRASTYQTWRQVLCVGTEGIATSPGWTCYPSTVTLISLPRLIIYMFRTGWSVKYLCCDCHKDLMWLQMLGEKKNASLGRWCVKGSLQKKGKVCSFHDFVSRITDPTAGGMQREQNAAWRRRMAGKKQMGHVFSVTLCDVKQTPRRCWPTNWSKQAVEGTLVSCKDIPVPLVG